MTSDMEKWKALHDVEMAVLADSDRRTKVLIERQNATSKDCTELVQTLEQQFAKVGDASTYLEQRAATGITQQQQAGIEATLKDLEAKLGLTHDLQKAVNEKIQAQLLVAQKLIRDASTGGAGMLKAPKLRKEDGNV